MRISVEMPQTTKLEFHYCPATPLPHIGSQDSISYYRDIGMSLVIAALSIIARERNPSRWPSMDKWIIKMGYRYTMGIYSAVKKS